MGLKLPPSRVKTRQQTRSVRSDETFTERLSQHPVRHGLLEADAQLFRGTQTLLNPQVLTVRYDNPAAGIKDGFELIAGTVPTRIVRQS